MKNINHELIESESLKALYIKIGSNVKKYREEKKITQLELAFKLNYKSPGFIANSEIFYRDKYHFNIAQLHKISEILDVPIQNFFL